MTFEIRCRSCGKSWQVDQHLTAGEMLCPVCLTRIDIRSPTREGPAAAGAAGASATPRGASKPLDHVPDEVVCPRCNLHFSPFSKRSRPSQGSTGRRKAVLIVEDQKYFREVAADSLSAVYDVKTAATVDEARVVLALEQVDLIVLDLTLEGNDSGREFLTTLTPKPCPIVIFTAQDESELYGDNWEQLAELGADGLVIKGMHVGESLLRKVAGLLGTPLEDLEDRTRIG